MDNTFHASRKMILLAVLLMLAGLAAIITGLITDPSRTWSNMLLNNMYFISISVGGLLFYALQFITGSSWSAMFQRIPLALGSFLPVGALLMLVLYFGLPDIYTWAQPGIAEADKLIAHKQPFLNTPFYMVRIILYFAMWVSLFFMLRKHAKNEDLLPGTAYYKKSRHHAKVFVFVATVFFSLAAKDWIMTIDAHWYSTLFGFRAMITSIYYAVAVIVLIILFLKRRGYFTSMGEAHRHDFARYLFRFSIVWGYLWFMQFLIIWYANIPELTAYYYPRFVGDWKHLFYLEMIMNFVIPFLIMMSDHIGKKPTVMAAISILLLAGLWVNLYLQIMPGSYGVIRFGFIETAMWLGYAGLFLLVVFSSLSRMALMPLNHPQLEESKQHHL